MGMLQKFAAGAASGVADVMKSEILTEQKMRIQGARDAKLEANRAAAAEKVATAKVTAAGLERTSREKIAADKLTAEAGGKRTANQRDVTAMVDSGLFKTEKEAWASIKGPNKGLLVPMFKMIAKRQTDAMFEPGDVGYLSSEDMMAEARRLIAGKTEKPSGKKPAAEEVPVKEKDKPGIISRFGKFLSGEDAAEPTKTPATKIPVPKSKTYGSKEDIGAAYNAGTINKDEALAQLRKLGFK